ncbi:HAD-IB family hydrolase [Inquilinus sp. CAU 1745]|uniref:HAD-IB family hydrolase n=1 Tax=Inquilinus sp. CAU 1745 TaxID=3140369 RepID=UPI00325AFCE7
MTRVAAFFDFDCTLTRQDTLMPWLMELRGRRRTYYTAVRVGIAHPFRRDTGSGDLRTRVKAALLARLLVNVAVDDAREAAARLFNRLDWRDDIVRAFEDHLEKGHRVVVATGAPTVVAEPLLQKRFGGAEIIGTELEVDGGRLTGRMKGVNCVRQGKAALVSDWLEINGPFEDLYGYGNRPHDLPMLALMTHRRIV